MAQILSNDTGGRRTTIRRYTLRPEHSLPSLDRPFRSPPEIEFFVRCCTQYAMHYRQEIGNAFPAKKGTQFFLSNKKKPHLVSSKTPGKLESSRAVVRQNPGNGTSGFETFTRNHPAETWPIIFHFRHRRLCRLCLAWSGL